MTTSPTNMRLRESVGSGRFRRSLELAERTVLASEHARLDAEIKAAEASTEAHDDALSPAEVKKLKSARAKAKRKLSKSIDVSLLPVARQRAHP